MDPLTQAKLAAYEEQRNGFFQLHAHAPTAIDGGEMKHAIQFRTWVAVTKDLAIPYWTPSAGTLEKAFRYADEAFQNERERRARQEREANPGADEQDAPGAARNSRKRNKEQLVRLIVDLEINVRNIILNHLGPIIGGAMGFDLSWGRWEIKSTESPITRALGELALANIKLVMPDFIARLHSDAKLKAQVEEGLQKDYDYRLKRKIADHLDTWVSEEAKRQSELIIASIKPKPPEKK
jgi:hypothetical protein